MTVKCEQCVCDTRTVIIYCYSYRPCLVQLIFSFFTNLSRSSAKQLASAAAYQFSCFSEYTKSSQ
ncbi:hypothetical protein Zm00014a_032023 [Zea mays]|uniref:Uncharacterized protein n=1 Tax=Zea mays TaxID=4577 RepID=A0A317Y5L9_MAIZE|nr:hypothetical protein Zm00014a_032023 [Zea mays]